MQHPLKFRTRLFAILLLFATVPAILITLLWGVTFNRTVPLVTLSGHCARRVVPLPNL